MNPSHELIGESPYQSIPYLPCSRLGKGEHYSSSAKYFTEELRHPAERIYITEKVDGSSVAAVRAEGNQFIAVNKFGHPVSTSHWACYNGFDQWVTDHRLVLLEILPNVGDRLCGEWLYQVHGIKYDRLPDLFLAFDIKYRSDKTCQYISTKRFSEIIDQFAFVCRVPIIYFGPPIDPKWLSILTRQSHFRLKGGRMEGCVLRRERDGYRIDIAKYTRPDHKAGIFLPETENAVVDEPVWNDVWGGEK